MVYGTNSTYGTWRNVESVACGFQKDIKVPNPSLSATFPSSESATYALDSATYDWRVMLEGRRSSRRSSSRAAALTYWRGRLMTWKLYWFRVGRLAPSLPLFVSCSLRTKCTLAACCMSAPADTVTSGIPSLPEKTHRERENGSSGIRLQQIHRGGRSVAVTRCHCTR
jgi:hypothetical protein